MNKTLELISLDDDELLGVVGGCGHQCSPCPPPQCHPEPCCPTLDVSLCVNICL